MIGWSCTRVHTRGRHFAQATTGRRRILASEIQPGCQGKVRGTTRDQVSPLHFSLLIVVAPDASSSLAARSSRIHLTMANVLDPRNHRQSTIPTS